MPVSFEKLTIGELYERPYLANLWGYKGFQAISRGVITPSESSHIVLFVTQKNQKSTTQYNNFIDENILNWEGETQHFSDNKIINAKSTNNQIHLFYRDIHHTPFLYYGNISLIHYILRTKEPSQFLFKLNDKKQPSNLLNELNEHKIEYEILDNTDREAIIKSRIGQGMFRARTINLWHSCAVTGLNSLSLLRASHIKPWKDASNQERLDPMNGLLLQPMLDYLFDLGFITFSSEGEIIISSKISQTDINKLGLLSTSKLRKQPAKLMKYMEYHRKNVFKSG